VKLIDKNEGYVAAAGLSIFGRYDKKMENKDNIYDKIKDLILSYCNKSLYCYARGISEQHGFRELKHNKSITRDMLRRKNYNDLTKEMVLYIDSGGFQCALGYIKKSQLDLYIDTYCEFLIENCEHYDWAFSLDMPPFDNLFLDADDMFKINIDSYIRLFGNLPQHVREKLIFVKHFRTPSQYDVWNRIINNKEVMSGFESNYWSVGGIVANLTGEHFIPYISYCIPFSEIFKWCLENDRKEVTIHILGGCSYRDIMYYIFAKRYAELKLGLVVHFTYDSTSLARQVLLGRYVYIINENGRMGKCSFKSDQLKDKVQGMTVNDWIYKCMRDVCEYADIDIEMPKNIYGEKNLNPVAEMLVVTYQVHLFKKMSDIYEKIAYSMTLEEMENQDYFDSKIIDVLFGINDHRYSRKFRSKTNNFHRSVMYLATGDKENNRKVINYYMAKDELKFINDVSVDTF